MTASKQLNEQANPGFSDKRPHDAVMVQVDYTLNGISKSFKVGMDRFDELIAWANKEFSDGSEPSGPDLPTETEPLAGVRRKKGRMASQTSRGDG